MDDLETELVVREGDTVICNGTLVIADLFDHGKGELMSSAEKTIQDELQATVDMSKYDIPDEGAHIMECLKRGAYSIFVVNSRGSKKPVNFRKPRELKTFCRSVVSGEIENPMVFVSIQRKRQDIKIISEPNTNAQNCVGTTEDTAYAVTGPEKAPEQQEPIHCDGSKIANDGAGVTNPEMEKYKASIFKCIIESSIKREQTEIKDKEFMSELLDIYIPTLKLDPTAASVYYNTWKEDVGKLPLCEKIMSERGIALLEPAILRRLEKKINLRGLLQDVISTLLNPSQRFGRRKRSFGADDSYDPSKAVYLMIQGALQGGKTEVKAFLVIVICFLFEMPAILVTNKSSFSPVLKASLKRLMKEMTKSQPLMDFIENNLFCIRETDDGAVRYKDIIDGFTKKGVLEGALLVLGDTASQVKVAHDLVLEMVAATNLPDADFALIFDESDAVTSRKPDIKLSQEVRKLQALGPLIQILVSATPLSNMVELKWIGAKNVMCHQIDPGPNYNGIECLKPLENPNDGSHVFLQSGGPACNKLSYSCDSDDDDDIPFTNEEVHMLYENALDSDDGSKVGVLAVIVLNGRVAAKGNIVEQAEKSQDFYVCAGKPFVAVTVVGKRKCRAAISVRCPEGLNWEDIEKKSIADVIHDLNIKFGLEMPIFVYGFSQLNRGVSIWSSTRVVTHIIVLRGEGFNIAEMVQTIGRACFQGMDILLKNGFKHVTILTTAGDLDTARQTNAFVNHLFYQVEVEKVPFITAFGGINNIAFARVKESLRDYGDLDAASLFPAETNLLRSTNRELSPRKEHKISFKNSISFEGATKMNYGEQEIYGKYLNNRRVQRFMRTLIDIDETNDAAFGSTEVRDKYEEMWNERIDKTKREGVYDLLKIFTKKGQLEKTCSEEDKKNPFYCVKNANVFRMVLNPDEDFVRAGELDTP